MLGRWDMGMRMLYCRCWTKASGGVLEGDASRLHHMYGGLWEETCTHNTNFKRRCAAPGTACCLTQNHARCAFVAWHCARMVETCSLHHSFAGVHASLTS